MCASCGCGTATHHGQDAHHHPHDHGHHEPALARTIALEEEILSRNNRIAGENRRWLEERGIAAVNFIGAPGSGKTTLLERTIQLLSSSVPISVLEGDQETELDAKRIAAAGAPVLQINTGSGCHLDARRVAPKLRELSPPPGSLLFVENVGNLVCPALFDIGERAKVVVMSITEGEEKPLKYPHVFRESEALVVNKIDLLPHLQFDLHRCLENARSVNPRLRIFPVSSVKGIGLTELHRWLKGLLRSEARAAPGGP